MTNIYKMSELCFFKKENRNILYKKNNHIVEVKLPRHTFASISKDFSKPKKNNLKPQIKICFLRYPPPESDCAILNCANATKPNAGHKIDNSKIKEGQLLMTQIYMLLIFIVTVNVFIHLILKMNHYMQ